MSNVSEINYEELIKQLLIPHRDSLLTRVFLIYRDYDKTCEILDILCSLNKKLNEECKCDIRNAINRRICNISIRNSTSSS
jgi:hypothetical protein